MAMTLIIVIVALISGGKGILNNTFFNSGLKHHIPFAITRPLSLAIFIEADYMCSSVASKRALNTPTAILVPCK